MILIDRVSAKKLLQDRLHRRPLDQPTDRLHDRKVYPLLLGKRENRGRCRNAFSHVSKPPEDLLQRLTRRQGHSYPTITREISGGCEHEIAQRRQPHKGLRHHPTHARAEPPPQGRG